MVDLGTIAQGEFAGGSVIVSSPNEINDQWTFTLDARTMTTISIDSNDSDPYFGIEGFTVTADFIADSSFEFDPVNNAWTYQGRPPPVSITLSITGQVSGEVAGQYQVLVGVLVPIPGAFLLFGSAILGLAALRRRQLVAL
ncbi:MAG: VPLPA-CTERM sorting domain-containing protein [Pseudomonadota bacterium]